MEALKKFGVDFLYKITSRKLWIWLVTTYITNNAFYSQLFKDRDRFALIILWGCVSFMYYSGDALSDALCAMISKGELKIGLGANISKTSMGER